MENLDLAVLRSLLRWREQGQHAVLSTVVRTWGSSPRPVGSIMALCETGAVVGSVSGGCIEDDLIHRYSQSLWSTGSAPEPWTTLGNRPTRLVYGVSADEAHRFGLPCGGTLELLLEFDPDAGLLAELVSALSAGHSMERHLQIASGAVRLSRSSHPGALVDDAQQLTNCFGPEYRMLLIGSGQLAEYLSTMAVFCGFAVTVCDPREEYRGSWSVPNVTLVHDMPDDVVRNFAPDSRSCVIALTHDPKLDDLALLEALDTDAFYIGAIGSRVNTAARKQRLIRHFAHTQASVARISGPVGVYIGSKTPPEIAVSIMAEVLAIKNGVQLPAGANVEVAKASLETTPPTMALFDGPAFAGQPEQKRRENPIVTAIP